jgi:hypothetical protein
MTTLPSPLITIFVITGIYSKNTMEIRVTHILYVSRDELKSQYCLDSKYMNFVNNFYNITKERQRLEGNYGPRPFSKVI